MEAQPPATAPAHSPTLGTIDAPPLLTAEFDADPGAVYRRLRERYGAVAPVSVMGVPVWLVLDYQEVLEVLRNESQWRRDVTYWRARVLGELPPDWPLLAAYEVRQMMFMDDEEHRAARRTQQTALSPFLDVKSPEGWGLRTAVARYADELIALLAADSGHSGFTDLAAQYTRPLLLMVTTRLFGCPVELGDELIMDLWRMLDGGVDSGAATERAEATFTRLVAHRRTRPGDDLTSYLMLADPGLSDEQIGRELCMNAVYLNDTTGNMILNTLLEVLRGNATVRRSLSAGQLGETLNRAALANPPMANLSFRFAARDARLGEFWVRAGDVVVPSAAAAHQNLIDIGASHMVGSTVSTRAHLGWSAGPHQCPSGARELATMLVNTSVGRLFDNFSKVELTLPPDQLPWRPSPGMRGLRLLPVRYEMRPEAPALQQRERTAEQTADRGDGQGGGLMAVLRRLMFTRRKDDSEQPQP